MSNSVAAGGDRTRGRMFPGPSPAAHGVNDDASRTALVKLSQSLVMPHDQVYDGPEVYESGLPAAYAHFAQLIAHDLTVPSFAGPRLALDSVYGRGPAEQPYLYLDDGRFVTGEEIHGRALGREFIARDLPRTRPSDDPYRDRNPRSQARAIIGDARNDDNVILAQLHGLVLQFHNRLAGLAPSPVDTSRMVRFHYQWLVIHDFLPKIVSSEVLSTVLPHLTTGSDMRTDPPQLQHYDHRRPPWLPTEFTGAAFRFWHAMLRAGYRLNDDVGPFPIRPLRYGHGTAGLTGYDAIAADWAIDWARLIDLEPRPPGRRGDRFDAGNGHRTQLAYLIDPSLATPLGWLPATSGEDESLAARDLLQGWQAGLPTGQDIARAMGVPCFDDDEIFIGSLNPSTPTLRGNIVETGGEGFAGRCPLWLYVLAEARPSSVSINTTEDPVELPVRQLGPVGGRIVAETLVGLLLADPESFVNLDPLWEPDPSVADQFREFGLREFIRAAIDG